MNKRGFLRLLGSIVPAVAASKVIDSQAVPINLKHPVNTSESLSLSVGGHLPDLSITYVPPDIPEHQWKQGMVKYKEGDNTVWYYTGTVWVLMAGPSEIISDTELLFGEYK